jgi:hypothetical protein
MGAENQPDGYHYKWAHKAHRILLTQDKDFLNNDLYPLALTRGVIIFNVDSSSTAELARAVEVVDVILSGIAPVLRQTKTIVNSDYTLTIIGREATNSGFAEKKTRYRLYRNGRDV